jgi:hypothetical protein
MAGGGGSQSGCGCAVVVDSGRMAETPRVSDVDAPAPDLAALAERTAELVGALRPEAGLDECVSVVRQWDALRREVETYRALVERRRATAAVVGSLVWR